MTAEQQKEYAMSDTIRVNDPLPTAGGNVTVFQNSQPLTGTYNGQGAGITVGNKTFY